MIPESFYEVVLLAGALGVKRINEIAGCWEPEPFGGWRVAVNGHAVETKDSRGFAVPAFSLAVWWGDWPAGVIGMDGGTFAAGEAANEDSFVAAVKARIAEVRRG